MESPTSRSTPPESTTTAQLLVLHLQLALHPLQRVNRNTGHHAGERASHCPVCDAQLVRAPCSGGPANEFLTALETEEQHGILCNVGYHGGPTSGVDTPDSSFLAKRLRQRLECGPIHVGIRLLLHLYRVEWLTSYCTRETSQSSGYSISQTFHPPHRLPAGRDPASATAPPRVTVYSAASSRFKVL